MRENDTKHGKQETEIKRISSFEEMEELFPGLFRKPNLFEAQRNADLRLVLNKREGLTAYQRGLEAAKNVGKRLGQFVALDPLAASVPMMARGEDDELYIGKQYVQKKEITGGVLHVLSEEIPGEDAFSIKLWIVDEQGERVPSFSCTIVDVTEGKTAMENRLVSESLEIESVSVGCYRIRVTAENIEGSWVVDFYND